MRVLRDLVTRSRLVEKVLHGGILPFETDAIYTDCLVDLCGRFTADVIQ